MKVWTKTIFAIATSVVFATEVSARLSAEFARKLGAGCVDDPSGWYDADGDDCDWYSEDDNCEEYGNGYKNMGKTANQACCACGGGEQGGEEQATTCVDDPSGWYDADGDDYDCDWYSKDDNCKDYGNDFKNMGKTANQACCECGGGVQKSSTSQLGTRFTCPSECKYWMLHDGVCNMICNNSPCGWDGQDCGDTLELTIKTCDKWLAGSDMNPQFKVYRDPSSSAGPSSWTFYLDESRDAATGIIKDDELPSRDTSKTYTFLSVPANMKIDLTKIRMTATNNNGFCLKSLAMRQDGQAKRHMRVKTNQSIELWLGRDWRNSSEDNESHRWHLYSNQNASK